VNVGNCWAGAQVIGDLGDPGKAEEGDSAMVIPFSETEPLATTFQFQRCTKNVQIYCLGSLIEIKLNV
jgi:hypothetical protein